MALATTMICLVLQAIRTVVPDENMPYDDPGDNSPDLGGTGGGPFGPGPGPSGNQGEKDPDLPSGEIEFQYGPGGNLPIWTWRKSSTTLSWILEAVLLYRCQMIVIHPWNSYLMEFTVHRQMMTIRRILWKSIRSLLLLEDLRMHQAFANPDQIMQPPPHVPQAAPQPIVSLPKHPRFPLPGVMRPPSPRNVPLTRSSGLHPDDTGPKAKLRFPSVGMKIPPPMQIAPAPKPPTPVPIQPVSVPKSRIPVTPVVTLPGQGVKDKGFPADPDLEPENEPGSSSNHPPSVPGLPV